MNITDQRLDQYLADLLPPRDEVLQEMEALAQKKNIPIIGPVVGRILYQIVRLAKAKRIFEMGSAIGYSTIWTARAAGEGATIFYTDGDPDNARQAAQFIARAGVRDRVRVMTGNALELIDQTAGEFDIIFCDIDKDQYPAAFRSEEHTSELQSPYVI